MTKGTLIASIAAGAVVALFAIPKTRKLITDALSSLPDSIKHLTSSEAEGNDRRVITG